MSLDTTNLTEEETYVLKRAIEREIQFGRACVENLVGQGFDKEADPARASTKVAQELFKTLVNTSGIISS